jgi:hypothetical protein
LSLKRYSFHRWNKIFGILVLLTSSLSFGCGGGSGSGGASITDNSSVLAVDSTIQGKLAQGYVKNAQVWYDFLDSSGNTNLQREPGEPDTLSAANGSYTLMNSENEGLLVAFGGTYLNSKGEEVGAAPMLAPKPGANQPFTNITPITTLVAAEPSLKLSLEQFGDWNADIANPNGTSAPLLRLAKTVESLSGILGYGERPIVADSAAQLRSIMILAEELNKLTAEALTDVVSIQAASTKAFDQILQDSSLVRPLDSAVKDQIKKSMQNLVNTIVSAIPATGNVVENDVVAQIEEAQEESNTSIQTKLDEQVTITIGGLGFEFDPIITKIILEFKSETLFMSAEVSDERPSTLSYRWTTSPSLSVTNPFSSEATLDGFDNSSITVVLRVTDDTETFITEICAWDYSTNPKTCSFLGN